MRTVTVQVYERTGKWKRSKGNTKSFTVYGASVKRVYSLVKEAVEVAL